MLQAYGKLTVTIQPIIVRQTPLYICIYESLEISYTFSLRLSHHRALYANQKTETLQQ